MAEEGKLKAQLGLDTKEFDKGLKEAHGSVQKFAGTMGGVSKVLTGLFSAGAVAGIATTIKKIFDTTQSSGDKLALTIEGIKSVALTTAQSLATMDFSVSLKDAYLAAKEYAAILDDLQDRQRSVNYLSKEYQLQIEEARGILRRVKLTTDERLAAEEKLRKAVDGELALHRQLAEEGIGAELGFLQKKYKLTQDDAKLVQEYVLNYANYSKEQQDAFNKIIELNIKYNKMLTPNAEWVKQITGEIAEETAKLPEEMRKYAAVWKPINDLTDKHRDKIVSYSQAYLDAQIALQRQLNLADRYGDALDFLGQKTEAVATATNEIPSLPLAAPMITGGNMTMPVPAVSTALVPMKENARVFVDFWSDAAQRFGSITMSIADSFANVGDVINNVMADSEVDFSEAMGVISKTALATIPVLEALAAAHIFAGEGWKGVAGVLAAIGGITMMLGVMSSLGKKRKMAEGGIVYGPTSALIGEYAGARTNPEVVAPLDRLQRLIGGRQTIEIVGKIKGTDIVLALERNLGVNYRGV